MKVSIFDAPFEHFLIDTVLDKETKTRLCKYFESKEKFLPASKVGRARSKKFDTRKIRVMRKSENDLFLSDLRCFLVDFAIPSLVEKYQSKFKKRLRSSSYELDILMVHDQKGFSLLPHTDIEKKLFTLIVYLQTDGYKPLLGTTLFKSSKSNSGGYAGDHHQNDLNLFDSSITLPFTENGGFFFVRSDESFHGFNLSNASFTYRNVLMVTAYEESLPEEFK